MVTYTKAPVSLESGDHLTREEYHRRYLARPDIKKAELVEGVVYVSSPVRGPQHGRPHGLVMIWLGHYAVLVPDVDLQDNVTVYLQGGNEVQPDAFLLRPEPGGAYFNEDGYLIGAPQLVVEVAASSVSYDLHGKKEAYRRNGVREYVVWRVLDEAIDWFRLQSGQYVLIQPDADGVIESSEFPGLRLHVQSMLAGDRTGIVTRLRGPA
jgi:Uma2 family endonuclease